MMFKKLLDGLAAIQTFISGTLFLVIFSINTMEIISRTFFNHSFLWVTDISTICIVWMIMLGMAVGVYQKEHIVLDLLISRFPHRLRHVVTVVITLLTFAFFVMLFVTGVEMAGTKRMLIFPTIRWSMIWAYSALPVFSLSAAVFMIPALIGLFRGKETFKESEGGDVRFL